MCSKLSNIPPQMFLFLHTYFEGIVNVVLTNPLWVVNSKIKMQGTNMCNATRDKDTTLKVQDSNVLKNIEQSNNGIRETLLPPTKTIHAPPFKGLTGEKYLIFEPRFANNI